MARAKSVPWTREHRLIALNIYGKLPFGKLHGGNPLIKDVALRMERSAGSLALKLCNFAALDPLLKARGISGMAGFSRADAEQWDEFHKDLNTFAVESEELLHDLFTDDDFAEVSFLGRDQVRIESAQFVVPPGPTEKLAMTKVRRGQQFFRQTTLNSYGLRCCMSGIDVPRFLVASHIKPWGKFPDQRLDPSNGLCLSSLHDAAFDSGLITLDEDLRIVLSSGLREHVSQDSLNFNFAACEGNRIRLPELLFEPSKDSLEYHRCTVFQG
jgi:putative restriction endonuclease